MPVTYDKIATNTVASATTSVTFSSIPGTYTDLIIVTNASASGGSDMYSRFNSDSGSNYSSTYLYGTGTSAGTSRDSNQTYLLLDSYGYLDTSFGQLATINVMNYSNTTTYKTLLSRANNANNGVHLGVNLWRSTAAITSITLYAGISGATFSVGSTFNLYGIKAA